MRFPSGISHGALLAALVALSMAGESNAQPSQDPAHPELLIVVNGASPVSVAIGDYYRAKRNVPASNVVTLGVPLGDPALGAADQELTTSRAYFDAQIRVPLEAFLKEHDLVEKIQIIVLASGIPVLYAPVICAFDAVYGRDCPRASVDAEVAVLFSNLVGAGGIGANGEAVNPYFDSTVPFAKWRADHPKAPLRYLVARLAGFQAPLDAASGIPADVKSLIDGARATPVRNATVLIDEDPRTVAQRRAVNVVLLGPIEKLLRGRGVSELHDQSTRFVASPARCSATRRGAPTIPRAASRRGTERSQARSFPAPSPRVRSR